LLGRPGPAFDRDLSSRAPAVTKQHNMAHSSAAAGLLSRQLKQMQNDKSISGISCGLVDNNVFEWEVMLMIDDDTKFYGGNAEPKPILVAGLTRVQEASSAHD
jgi:hypothetical protein